MVMLKGARLGPESVHPSRRRTLTLTILNIYIFKFPTRDEAHLQTLPSNDAQYFLI